MLAQMLAPAAVLVAWSIVILFWMAFTRVPALGKAGGLGNAKPGGRGQDVDGGHQGVGSAAGPEDFGGATGGSGEPKSLLVSLPAGGKQGPLRGVKTPGGRAGGLEESVRGSECQMRAISGTAVEDVDSAVGEDGVTRRGGGEVEPGRRKPPGFWIEAAGQEKGGRSETG